MSWTKSPPDNYSIYYNSENDPYFVHERAILSSNCRIGGYSYIHGTTRMSGSQLITIGKFCSIASEVRFQAGDEHDYKRISTYPFQTILDFNSLNYNEVIGHGLEIGSDVWIGEGARLLSGSLIGDGVVIGAGSVVRGYLQPYGVYSGNPAVLRRFRFDVDVIQKLLEIKWWNWSIDKVLKNGLFFSLSSEDVSKLTWSEINGIIK